MTNDRSAKALVSLRQLRDLLVRHKMVTYLEDIEAAIEDIEHGAFEHARSIYLGITNGGRLFAETYVQRPNGEPDDEQNGILGALREDLLEQFK